MIKASVDPIVHCMIEGCQGSGTEGEKRNVQSEHSCPNGRLPYYFYTSCEYPTKVRRQVLPCGLRIVAVRGASIYVQCMLGEPTKGLFEPRANVEQNPRAYIERDVSVTGEKGEPDYKRTC